MELPDGQAMLEGRPVLRLAGCAALLDRTARRSARRPAAVLLRAANRAVRVPAIHLRHGRAVHGLVPEVAVRLVPCLLVPRQLRHLLLGRREDAVAAPAHRDAAGPAGSALAW